MPETPNPDQLKPTPRAGYNNSSPAAAPGCSAPTVNALLTAYCFGRATPAERRSVEEHLPDCPACDRELARLSAAVRVLDEDPQLVQTLTPAGVAGAFGASGQFHTAWGGLRSHVQFASLLYAGLGGLCVVMELGYEFTRYAVLALVGALVAGLWLYATTRVALWCDWKLTRQGNGYGLAVAMFVAALACALLAVAGAVVLPAASLTRLTDASLPAPTAYLKDLLYHLIYLFFFTLPLLHCVWWLQRELAEGKHASILSLLTGNRRSVSPRGLLLPKLWLLVLIALFIFVYSIYAHFNLMSKLQHVGQYILFATLVHLRLLGIYVFIARCLYWYAAQLNELKRECLIAERLERADLGWK